jgi:hypothetical protein
MRLRSKSSISGGKPCICFKRDCKSQFNIHRASLIESFSENCKKCTQILWCKFCKKIRKNRKNLFEFDRIFLHYNHKASLLESFSENCKKCTQILWCKFCKKIRKNCSKRLAYINFQSKSSKYYYLYSLLQYDYSLRQFFNNFQCFMF